MFHPTTFSAFFMTAFLAVHCGFVSKSRIVGGQPITINKCPHQVILEYNNWLICGGSTISKNIVLTAAHCLDFIGSSRLKYFKIRAGTSYPGRDGSVHEIEKITIHENYNTHRSSVGPMNDIGLIFVKIPLKFDSTRKAIKLYKSKREIADDTSTFITGYGSLNNEGKLPEQLQGVNVPYVPKHKCNAAYGFHGGIGQGQVCAGVLGVGGKDSCFGDSGGPMVVNAKLVGITSYGMNCGDPNYPGVYTEVAYYYNWIINKTSKLKN